MRRIPTTAGNGTANARAEITPEGLDAIALWASQGKTAIEIARGLSLSTRTFGDLRKRNEACQQALEYGNALFVSSLVNVLYQKALKGDSVSCMFLLKTRGNFRESGAPTGDTNIRNINILNLPQASSPEAYAEMLARLKAPTEQTND